MLKIIFLNFLCLLGLVSITTAQTSSLISAPIEVPKYGYISNVLGEYNSKTYILRKDDDFFIDVFDSNLKKVKSIPLSLKNGQIDLVLYSIELIGKEIVVFGSGYEESSKSRILFGTLISTESSVSNLTWQKLIVVKDVHEYQLNLEFDVTYSPDLKHILVLKEQKVNNELYPTAYVFDSNLKLEYQKEFKEIKYDYFSAMIDDKLNIIISGTNDMKMLDVYTYLRKEDHVTPLKLEIGENFLGSCNYSIQAGKVVISTVYASKKTRDLEGLVFFTIDMETKEVNKIQQKFPSDLLSAYLSEKQISKGVGLSNFAVVNFFLQENGDGIFICEQSSYMRSTSGDDHIHYWDFDDILVARLGVDESKNFYTRIPKNQSGSKTTSRYISSGSLSRYDERFTSIATISQNDIKVYYNDNPKSLNDDGKVEKLGRKGSIVPVMATIDFKGKKEIKSLNVSPGGSANSKFYITPKLSKNVADGKLLIIGSEGDKEYYLMKL